MYPSNQIFINQADQDLQVRVVSFLRSRHFPSFHDIEVDVRDGVVILKGNVRLFYEKQVALCTCRHVAGVLTMVDNINVVPKPLSKAKFDEDKLQPRKPR